MWEALHRLFVINLICYKEKVGKNLNIHHTASIKNIMTNLENGIKFAVKKNEVERTCDMGHFSG